jgi:hypothetical protein
MSTRTNPASPARTTVGWNVCWLLLKGNSACPTTVVLVLVVDDGDAVVTMIGSTTVDGEPDEPDVVGPFELLLLLLPLPLLLLLSLEEALLWNLPWIGINCSTLTQTCRIRISSSRLF